MWIKPPHTTNGILRFTAKAKLFPTVLCHCEQLVQTENYNMEPVSDQTKSESSIYSAEQKDPRSIGTGQGERERDNLFILTNVFCLPRLFGTSPESTICVSVLFFLTVN